MDFKNITNVIAKISDHVPVLTSSLFWMPVILLQCGIENTNRLLLRLDSIYYSHELVLTLFAVCAILVVIFWKDNYSEDFFNSYYYLVC